MKKIIALLTVIVLLTSVPVAFAHGGTPAPDPAPEPTLWITDDYITQDPEVGRRVYHVSLDGMLLSSFPTLIRTSPTGNPFRVSPSGIAVDAGDDSLWVVIEKPGRLVNYTKAGEQIGEVIATDWMADIGPEGVDVDPFDASLWIVSDWDPPQGQERQPDDPVDTVYNIDRGGNVLSEFPVPDVNPNDSTEPSPQAIAVDPFDGTLWITDNNAETIYNITMGGSFIASFPTTTFAPDEAANNPQGISVDRSDGTLWVTDRATSEVYHIERTGKPISQFNPTFVVNPTGVAYDGELAAPTTPAPREIKRSVRDDLAALLPTGSYKTDYYIGGAIKYIEQSLNEAYWTSDSTLDERRGWYVFVHELAAVVKLEYVVYRGGAHGKPAQNAIDRLVEADRQLAQVALDAAIDGGGHAYYIKLAKAAMDRADTLAERGRSGLAIWYYGRAWRLAVRAL